MSYPPQKAEKSPVASPQKGAIIARVPPPIPVRLVPVPVNDMVMSIIADEGARFVARVLKRAFNEIPEDKLKDGVIQLWNMLSELPNILGPEIMQDVKELVPKLKGRLEEVQKMKDEEAKKAKEKFVKAVAEAGKPPETEKEKKEG